MPKPPDVAIDTCKHKAEERVEAFRGLLVPVFLAKWLGKCPLGKKPTYALISFAFKREYRCKTDLLVALGVCRSVDNRSAYPNKCITNN